jgi:hypothetical protein
MTRKLREALERIEELTSDGDQAEIKDALAELAGELGKARQGSADTESLSEALGRIGLSVAAELAAEIEKMLDEAPSDGEEAEEADEAIRERLGELHTLLNDEL